MSFLREPNTEPIPGYRLIEPLGSGGFGEVWKCEAPGGLFKAIKFVFGNLNSLDVDGARAGQELKALNRIKEVRHPFILSMDRIEVVEGELVIVMELADKSLHDAFQECVSAGMVGIPRDTLLRYIRDAAEALDHMNEKHGLQHLDIKPRNLFLVSDRVKVADFGLVKHLERASGVMGAVTPLYAPPETFTGGISDRTDQYSLAIVYQELLTGQRPFTGKNARQLAHQHLNEGPDLRSLPEADRPVLARALDKDPAKRFPNCLSFVRALYTARAASSAAARQDVGGRKPKTMADTLENFQLEQNPGPEEVVPADLGGVDLPTFGPDGGSNLGHTLPQPDTGALRPTVVLGLGAMGRHALMELRCRFLDRFGSLDKLPLIRFLYVDTDGDAVKAALRGSPEVAFRPSEVYHLALQPVSHYRRRQLDQLGDWLPREKLYAMPRALKTQGSRSLGRLAFSDHYMRLLARLRREVQHACHPDAVYQTVTQTGLALRDNVPRVYVLGSASGGASGYLPDLGYALRRLLKQMHQPEAPVLSFLFCGAPDDPATPRSEQANLYATLTELNHFADPAIPFSAQYGTDGPRLVDEGPPYDHTYLITQRHRAPEARRDALAHLGSYLFHELATPLGLRLEQLRLKRRTGDQFRSLGTFGVWFPRGLLLRLAARGACQRLVEEWLSGGSETEEEVLTGPEQSVLDAALARVLADPELSPEALATRLAERAGTHLEGHPREALTRLLLGVEEQSLQPIAQEDPGAWARQALARVQGWLGGGLSAPGMAKVQQQKSPLTKALESASGEVAQEWDGRLADAVTGLTEHPGRRLAVAEAALLRLARFCTEAGAAHQARLAQQQARSQEGQTHLESALAACITGQGGWSLFGGKSRRVLRVFVDHLAAFARQCLAEDTASAVLHFYAALRGRLDERLRDLTFCRQRLRHMHEALDQYDCFWDLDTESGNDTPGFARTPGGGTTSPFAPGLPGTPGWAPAAVQASPVSPASTQSFWESIRVSATTRVVLPDGNADLAQAARRFLGTLSADQWTQLDQSFGDQVLAPRGGLQKACLQTSDLMRHLVVPLLNEAITCLSNHLPITDVAQAEFAATALDQRALAGRVRSYHASSAPVVGKGVRALKGKGYAEVRSPSTEHPCSLEGSRGVRQAVLAGAGGEHPDEGANGRRPAGRGANRPGVPDEYSFLLIPASEAGRSFGEEARRAVPELHLVNVPGQADLMFCTEQTSLTEEDLEPVLRSCREAYQDLAVVPNSSPHARFDIQDWTPLAP